MLSKGLIRGITDRGTSQGNLCISLGKQRSEGGRLGQAAKESRVDWYAQAAFPQGRFVSYAAMSSKGTPGCRGAPGMLQGWIAPLGTWVERQVSVGASHFPGGSSSLPLIFLTKHSAMGSSKNPCSLEKPEINMALMDWDLGGCKCAGISHFAQAPAGIRCWCGCLVCRAGSGHKLCRTSFPTLLMQ